MYACQKLSGNSTFTLKWYFKSLSSNNVEKSLTLVE